MRKFKKEDETVKEFNNPMRRSLPYAPEKRDISELNYLSEIKTMR